MIVFEKFMEWLSKQEGTFHYEDCSNCALAQYLRSTGLFAVVGGMTYTINGDRTIYNIDDIAPNFTRILSEAPSDYRAGVSSNDFRKLYNYLKEEYNYAV